MQMGQNDLERSRYEWQVGNLKFGTWGANLREQLDKTTGLGHIWQNKENKGCKYYRQRHKKVYEFRENGGK
jgi:hypothetical protein